MLSSVQGLKGQKTSHWGGDGYTQESNIQAEQKYRKNSKEQEWEDIIRPISKHHFLKYPNPWSINLQEPPFAKQMEFKITVVIINIAPFNRVPVFSQNDSLLELQALNLGLFYPLSGSNMEAFQFDLEFLFPFWPSTYRAEELGEVDFFSFLRYSWYINRSFLIFHFSSYHFITVEMPIYLRR